MENYCGLFFLKGDTAAGGEGSPARVSCEEAAAPGRSCNEISSPCCSSRLRGSGAVKQRAELRGKGGAERAELKNPAAAVLELLPKRLERGTRERRSSGSCQNHPPALGSRSVLTTAWHIPACKAAGRKKCPQRKGEVWQWLSCCQDNSN